MMAQPRPNERVAVISITPKESKPTYLVGAWYNISGDCDLTEFDILSDAEVHYIKMIEAHKTGCEIFLAVKIRSLLRPTDLDRSVSSRSILDRAV